MLSAGAVLGTCFPSPERFRGVSGKFRSFDFISTVVSDQEFYLLMSYFPLIVFMSLIHLFPFISFLCFLRFYIPSDPVSGGAEVLIHRY